VTAPEVVSACDGWTAHEIAAHVTGNAVEIVRHLEPYLQGDPVPETCSFEEREAPLRELAHADLLARLDRDEQRIRAVVADVLAREPEAVIAWTGRQMSVAKFVPHMRNEHALHRWDVAGDDSVSLELLAEPDLAGHSVGVLGAILLVAGRKHDPDPDSDFGVRLRSDGQPDLLVMVERDDATLAWAGDERDEPCVELDRPPGSCSSGGGAPMIMAGFAATWPSTPRRSSTRRPAGPAGRPAGRHRPQPACWWPRAARTSSRRTCRSRHRAGVPRKAVL
jgi:hypothetical protein